MRHMLRQPSLGGVRSRTVDPDLDLIGCTHNNGCAPAGAGSSKLGSGGGKESHAVESCAGVGVGVQLDVIVATGRPLEELWSFL